MTAVPVNYTHKPPAIEVVRFDTSDLQTMQDVQSWCIENLPVDTEVTLRTSMGGTLFWPGVMVYPGEYIAKDANGKLFKMNADTLNAFYDRVV